jgi:hypothetical protein
VEVEVRSSSLNVWVARGRLSRLPNKEAIAPCGCGTQGEILIRGVFTGRCGGADCSLDPEGAGTGPGQQINGAPTIVRTWPPADDSHHKRQMI